MDFDWVGIARAASTALPAIAALAGLSRGPGRLRANLKHDAEILAKLPPDSSAYAALLRLVEAQVARMAKLETEATRHWSMFVVALLVTPLLGWLTIWLVQTATWWSILLAAPVGLLAIVFVYGIFETAQKVPRDSKGKRI